MALYHSNGPVGGYTVGYVAAGVAFTLWTCVFLYYFIFYKRKERLARKRRQQMRFAPTTSGRVATRKKQTGG